MFNSIIVPVDFEVDGDRALFVAAVLARRAALPLTFVTVSSPGIDAAADELLLDLRCARVSGARTDRVVLRSNNPAGTIVDFLDDRPGALVVMGTHARGPLGERLFGSVSESVLAGTICPVVMVGPHVATTPPPAMATLVAGLDGSATSEAVLPTVSEWVRTFGGNPPWLVQVVEPRDSQPDDRGGDLSESGYLGRLAARLRDEGTPAEFDIAHGRRPVPSLLGVARRIPGPVLAVASERWTDRDSRHSFSTARALARQSPYPVLVVHAAAPADEMATTSVA